MENNDDGRILCTLSVALILGLFAFAMLQPSAEAQPRSCWYMHIAVDELREARKESCNRWHDFGGHHAVAILASMKRSFRL